MDVETVRVPTVIHVIQAVTLRQEVVERAVTSRDLLRGISAFMGICFAGLWTYVAFWVAFTERRDPGGEWWLLISSPLLLLAGFLVRAASRGEREAGGSTEA